MGFRNTFIAVQNESVQRVCEGLGLRRTNRYQDINEGPACGADLESGWYLVQLEGAGKLLGKAGLLSQYNDVVCCVVCETSMNSYASIYSEYTEQWSVSYDGSAGGTSIETSGTTPPQIKKLIKEAANDSSELFDVPVRYVESLLGFRYDSDVKTENNRGFEVLKF